MLNPTQGPAREVLDADEIAALRSSVIVDERRRRPLYFDGRFLAAADLVRDQQYFLARQGDLGRAGGAGVVAGLQVSRGSTPMTLRVAPGHGITPAGELVMLPRELTVDLGDLPTIQRLDAAFGLLEIPREPARSRTGLFVLALRPVEFSATPIASYPTAIDGARTVEMGDIVEGVVATLIPYPDAGAAATADQRRSRAAYEIFVNRSTKSMQGPVLPLAMVQLNRGVVEWVDPYLVRREVGADQGDVLGLGYAPRVLRESHLLQYDHQLREVIRARGTRGERFAASEYFQALPPAGRMPSAAIDPAEFTQVYFPATVDVDLTIVPADEVNALLEESLLLPPLDLTRTAEELDSTSVMVAIPVPRAQFRALQRELEGALERRLNAAAPWALARRNPVDVLRGLRLPPVLVPVPEPTEGADSRWRTLLAGTSMLWYLRRRNLSYRGDVVGQPLAQLTRGMVQSISAGPGGKGALPATGFGELSAGDASSEGLLAKDKGGNGGSSTKTGGSGEESAAEEEAAWVPGTAGWQLLAEPVRSDGEKGVRDITPRDEKPSKEDASGGKGNGKESDEKTKAAEALEAAEKEKAKTPETETAPSKTRPTRTGRPSAESVRAPAKTPTKAETEAASKEKTKAETQAASKGKAKADAPAPDQPKEKPAAAPAAAEPAKKADAPAAEAKKPDAPARVPAAAKETAAARPATKPAAAPAAKARTEAAPALETPAARRATPARVTKPTRPAGGGDA